VKRALCAAVCAWVLAGCEDGARRQATAAIRRYEALVAEQRHPGDPAFVPVLAELERAKAGTPDGDKAREIAAGLRRARALPMPPRPLAVGPHGDEESPEIQARRAVCEALAKELGRAPEPEKPALKGRLLACRMELERLDAEALHHGSGH
jgi:hypothetical protein